uniref:Uncharacterized protein n=1 Tax=Proteus vulgaris TaxID=585 RepID=Q8KJY5_PROVU|nr:hypothetical protein [Proteus vulgaris]
MLLKRKMMMRIIPRPRPILIKTITHLVILIVLTILLMVLMILIALMALTILIVLMLVLMTLLMMLIMMPPVHLEALTVNLIAQIHHHPVQ